MATSTQRRKSITEYYTEMSEMIGLRALKTFRIVWVSTVLLAVYWVAVQAGAQPWPTGGYFITAILAVAGVEMAELEALRKLTNLNISFSSKDD